MHHSRRKSGHGSTNSSTTDVRKAGTTEHAKPRRPQTLSRKSTPQTVQKLGKNPRDREREWEEERWFEDDERESFPQFWYVCSMLHYVLSRLLAQGSSFQLISWCAAKRHATPAPEKGVIGLPFSLVATQQRYLFGHRAWAASPAAISHAGDQQLGMSCVTSTAIVPASHRNLHLRPFAD